MVEKQTRPVYIVALKRKTPKSANEYFIVSRTRGDEFLNSAVFHGIGFWSKTNTIDIINDQQITEIWIPWVQIDHIESLMYRQRS